MKIAITVEDALILIKTDWLYDFIILKIYIVKKLRSHLIVE